MRSPHNAAARWALHDVAERLIDSIGLMDHFGAMHVEDWRVLSAAMIERLRIDLAHLNNKDLGMIRSAMEEQRRADAMTEDPR